MSSKITTFSDLPQYPSIGSILKRFAQISGLTESEFDYKKSFRKQLSRLEKQTEKQIDLDNYLQVLSTIINRHEDITMKYPYHWLSGAQIHHYFSAYQQLILYLPMFRIDQNEINTIVGMFFLIWSVRRYSWWRNNYPEYAEKHADSWWLNEIPSKDTLAEIIKNLKKNLGDKEMTDWALIGLIHLDKDLSKSDKTELQKQINSWRTGSSKPKFSTIKANITDPLKDNFPEEAQIFEIDFLVHKWIGSWLELIPLPYSKISNIILEEYNSLRNKTDPLYFLIPSKTPMKKSQSLSDLLDTFSNVIEIYTEKDFLNKWKIGNSDPILATLFTSNLILEDIYTSMKCIEYRHGVIFSATINSVLSNTTYFGEDRFETIFKTAYFHGIIESGYKDTKSWILYKNKDKNSMSLKYHEILHLSETNLKWLYFWNDENINDFIPICGFSRTRLMIAVYRCDIMLTKKLLAAGAKIDLLSIDTDDAFGDNSSALLFALLAYEVQVTGDQKSNVGKVIKKILEHIEQLDTDNKEKLLNTPQCITKRIPLNIAIDYGNIPIAIKLIDLGTDPNREIGGDDRTPLYEAIDALGKYIQLKSTEDFDEYRKKVEPNYLRMEVDPAYIQEIGEQMSSEAYKKLISKAFYSLRNRKPATKKPYYSIIKILIDNGADINKLNKNGRYPLDMALEIEENTGEKDLVSFLYKLGAKKRAIY